MEKLVRKIGLVAHDAMKKDLIEWVLWNSELLMGHKFYCTGTTGTLILEALREKHPDVEWDFTILKSGPLGGDQQMGSRIVDGEIDYLFFFTDPMTLQPHDTDVKALTRLASVENIVFCCNRSTADHIISSPLFVDPTYERTVPDYSNYTKRFANKPVVAEAVESAKKKGLTVSCDLNYRSALWSVEKASKTLAPLLYQTDVLIANENHLKMLFGIGEGGNLTCAESAAAAAEKFGLSQSVMTVRRTLSADDNNFSAVLYEKGRHFRSKKYRMHIVDRVGGGDSFAAGLIFGNVKGFSAQDTVEFAAAAGCLKHSVEGDAGIFTEREVLSLAGGLSDGRVQR